MWKKIKPYVISVAIALLVGGLSAWVTKDSMQLYGQLKQPPLAPSSAVFPIVWTVLFILMGISAARIYLKGGEEKTKALVIYGAQLAVNFLWSVIFFNLRAYLFAFIWLLLLWLLILLMILQFRKIDKAAAWLQIPYLLWVTFAGYLNFMIFLLNS